MTTKKRQFGLAVVLLTASLLALYPTMTLEKPQQGSAVVSIKADGQAFPNGKNKPSSAFSSATLTLYGSVQMKGDGALKLNDLAGSLQIGISNYTIASGEGEVNKKGKIQINAKTSDAGKNLELILHGSTDGDAIVFDRKESKLSSLYFLSLKGQAIVTLPTTSTSSTESDDDDEQPATVTVTQTNTVTETATQTQNYTVTATETATLTQNYTVTATETNNQTLTETVTQTVTAPATNSTITVTETTTQTVTEPVANSTATVTETVTSTIVNYTTTATTTVANTTLTTTVWNSTQTTPPI